MPRIIWHQGVRYVPALEHYERADGPLALVLWPADEAARTPVSFIRVSTNLAPSRVAPAGDIFVKYDPYDTQLLDDLARAGVIGPARDVLNVGYTFDVGYNLYVQVPLLLEPGDTIDSPG